MALISEVAEKIYEIKPEGQGHEIFPLCTVYLVIDDKTALVEVGSPVQIPLNDEGQCTDTALKAMKAGEDQEKIARRLAGIIAKESVLTAEEILTFPYFATMTVEGYRQSFKRKKLI